MLEKIDLNRLPAHIAIIMDGNGRWAKKRCLPRVLGHREGVKRVREIVESCSRLNIRALTLYAFSAENWARPGAEVKALMTILKSYLKKEYPVMMKNNVRLRAVGDIAHLPPEAREELKETVKKTEKNSGLALNLALNYGGRQEIVRAVNRLVKQGRREVDENLITEALDTAGLPDPDLLIRTSGEMRVSNFLLWQIAYTEFYVTKTLWPDFRENDLYRAIEDFQSRERRFGGV
ncbi:MAG: isoprenyl transferase [Endomicrobiales bacterium]